MKKQKLKLDALKVESFVTEMEKDGQETAQGGGGVVLNTYPMCGLISVFFICDIAPSDSSVLRTWEANCQ